MTIDDGAVAAQLAETLDTSSRRWRSPEEHAMAMVEALRSRGWSVVDSAQAVGQATAS